LIMDTPVVLITGALIGIGRAAAVAFAKKGAKVVVSGRHNDKGQALVAELQALGAQAAFVRADVQKEDDVRDLVDQTIARFGRLDVAVNNAGFEGSLGLIQDTTEENFRAVHDTNVVGVFLSMKHELRAMAGQGSGSIINITSKSPRKHRGDARQASRHDGPSLNSHPLVLRAVRDTCGKSPFSETPHSSDALRGPNGHAILISASRSTESPAPSFRSSCPHRSCRSATVGPEEAASIGKASEQLAALLSGSCGERACKDSYAVVGSARPLAPSTLRRGHANANASR
jgi:NAD(P)-dependent dehydrogenase (short-subunit alcohol dehydrogenase family)